TIEENMSPTLSTVYTIKKDIIEQEVMATGILKPYQTVFVGAQVNGQLKKIYVKEGDKVKKGQILAVVDPSLQQSELINTQAQLDSALANKKVSETLLEQYRRELERQKIMKKEGAGTEAEYDVAKSLYTSQKEQIKINKAQIVQAEMAVQAARTNLDYTKIVAPIDGEVLGVLASEGQTIVSSQSAPTIFVLANIDKMIVETNISEADIQKVISGQKVKFNVSSQPDHTYESILSVIQSAPREYFETNPASQRSSSMKDSVYYVGEFEINNAERKLKTSMTALVYINTLRKENILKLPIIYLGRKTGFDKYIVYLYENSSIVEREIETGVRSDDFVEVVSGLNEGDKVILKS
ncbi:efflux RND transporter periplasmic adaptor subunit, partial [Salmonella enterica]|nr:efflux RND transporter periplasmic adaptor subunit [Salmonella enterica]